MDFTIDNTTERFSLRHLKIQQKENVEEFCENILDFLALKGMHGGTTNFPTIEGLSDIPKQEWKDLYEWMQDTEPEFMATVGEDITPDLYDTLEETEAFISDADGYGDQMQREGVDRFEEEKLTILSSYPEISKLPSFIAIDWRETISNFKGPQNEAKWGEVTYYFANQ